MSLRKKAVESRPPSSVSWLTSLDKKTQADIKDLWLGFRAGEYSAAHARRVLESELGIKVSRSAFNEQCIKAWELET